MEFGWKNIWRSYGCKELFSKKNRLFYFCVGTVIIFLLVIIIFNKKSDLTYNLIGQLVDISISILPTLLGFNLGAYALIIGFLSNKNLSKALTEKNNETNLTSLQRISGVFAINIITQAFTLLCTFLIKTFMIIDSKLLLGSVFSDNFIDILNYCSFIFISFFILYSIALVIQNAINIFDFSQLFAYFSNKEENEN